MVAATPLDRLGHAIAATAPHLPPAVVQTWADALTAPMRSTGITSNARIAAFIGQVAEESGGFSSLQEDLDYSAERLCEVWPHRFPTEFAALACAHNPQKLADTVYQGRLGNTEAGDGWRFRGEGLIQLTGRGLDTMFAKAVNLTPDAVAAWMLTPAGAATSACWFWGLPRYNRPSLNMLADGWQLTNITRVVNGGLTNLQRRVDLSNAARHALTGGA